MICKIFHRTVFFLAALACLQLTSCGGGGGGDDDDRYTTTPAGSLTVSEFNSFKAGHGSYFEDGDFANLIATIISGGSPRSVSNTYYISPNGNDSNTGLFSQDPLKTFSAAFNKMSYGSTLIVMDGTYTPDNNGIEVNFNSGSSSNYIKIKAQNKGRAIISGGNTTKANDYALMSISGRYIMIDGLVFKDLKAQNGATGIRLENGANHIIIANCTFTNIRTESLVTEASKDNENLQYTANAIIGYGDSNTSPISSILIYKNTCTNMETGWGECISLTENCTHVSIIENYLDDTGNIGIDVGGNYVTRLPANLRFTRYAYIAHNTVVNESTEDTYGDTCYGIYADGGQHIQIIGNKVANCMGGIEAGAEEVNEDYPTDDITISGNEIVDCQEVFFACGGYETDRGWVKNVKFTNNTCTARNTADLMVNLAKCDTVEISGNTFTKMGSFEMEGIYKEFNSSYTKNITERDNTWIGF
ncbi:MAG: hypothetical protein J6P28_09490 [Treponema sp.]|nr:hypothetical protein [Treponema sp.]